MSYFAGIQTGASNLWAGASVKFTAFTASAKSGWAAYGAPKVAAGLAFATTPTGIGIITAVVSLAFFAIGDSFKRQVEKVDVNAGQAGKSPKLQARLDKNGNPVFQRTPYIGTAFKVLGIAGLVVAGAILAPVIMPTVTSAVAYLPFGIALV